jgi:hypothetical protein
LYGGDEDPKPILDYSIRICVDGKPHHELIDSQLNYPWCRVVLSNIKDMKQ